LNFDPQRKSSFTSGSRLLCQISSKFVKNCDRESAHTQTHRQTDRETHKVKTLSLHSVHYIHLAEIITAFSNIDLRLISCFDNCGVCDSEPGLLTMQAKGIAILIAILFSLFYSLCITRLT